ncbi:LrgB family protein [Pseudogemmobacter humi]|uniref:Inner membrane protein YohK n=1 Tax=Pseudogemmobacter humi TaxID=2483812 RepID=A0A3P5XG73_9RHOB|nr:LrgB family protein [Pseudogemmobacter humi]VDC33765.1 Inner membrane protein YohK [Pseudogemmobacter humi]
MPESLIHILLWSSLTIGFYWLSKRIYRRWPRWWLMPLAVTPLLLMMVVVSFHESYRDYIDGTHWLVLLLGPATVAFAIPIYEQRGLIRRHWPVLLVGMLVGSVVSILSSWGLAALVGLDGAIRLSLLPRSVSTPFAMEVSGEIGGIPDLTAVFVVITGIAGAVLGDLILARFRIATALARGSLFGLGAHGAGTARAHQIGATEGAVAGLVMVLVGLLNVLAAPLVALLPG